MRQRRGAWSVRTRDRVGTGSGRQAALYRRVLIKAQRATRREDAPRRATVALSTTNLELALSDIR